MNGTTAPTNRMTTWTNSENRRENSDRLRLRYFWKVAGEPAQPCVDDWRQREREQQQRGLLSEHSAELQRQDFQEQKCPLQAQFVSEPLDEFAEKPWDEARK